MKSEEKQRAIEKAQISEEKKNKLYEKARKQTDDGLTKLKLFKAQSEKLSSDAKSDARDLLKNIPQMLILTISSALNLKTKITKR